MFLNNLATKKFLRAVVLDDHETVWEICRDCKAYGWKIGHFEVGHFNALLPGGKRYGQFTDMTNAWAEKKLGDYLAHGWRTGCGGCGRGCRHWSRCWHGCRSWWREG